MMNTAVGVSAVPFVAPEHFLLATRDAGYRNLASALNELIDNALQADATRIEISIQNSPTTRPDSESAGVVVAVLDNGRGMGPAELVRALQFGGSSRFDDRSGLGRFGMGLPNSSVSHARRLEVYTWQSSAEVFYSYLDVDEVVTGHLKSIPRPRRRSLPDWTRATTSRRGTLVVWSRCDRISRMPSRTSLDEMRRALGRVYRYPLWKGTRIVLNGVDVEPFDPLYLDSRTHTNGARRYGAPLVFRIVSEQGEGEVEVTFSELPVHRWHAWAVEEKRRRGIVGGAGVSIVRAHREVAYGWLFFGSKRRENYDDWWRCEIRFPPALDRMFGVTFNKQGVRPSSELKQLLSQDLDEIARTLNGRVRAAFASALKATSSSGVLSASRHDVLLARPAGHASRTTVLDGLRYRLEFKPIQSSDFYAVRCARGSVAVTVNTDHPFYTEMYDKSRGRGMCSPQHLERLVLAAARADLEARGQHQRMQAARLRRAWSDAIAAFLRS